MSPGDSTRRRRKAAKSSGASRKPVARVSPAPRSGTSRKAGAAPVRELEVQLAHAREQLAATGEILRVIAASPAAVEPVLDAMLASAGRLCHASDVGVLRVVGDELRWAAGRGPLIASVPGDLRIPLTRGSVASRAVVDRATVHVLDFLAEPDAEYPVGRVLARRFGHRAMLAVPLLREGVAIGVICAFRLEARAFSPQHIELLETFAAQAVIAIENARLFNELREKNGALTESLDQQTATAEILQVISRSPTDVQPVFDAIADSAMRLFGAWSVGVFRFDGDLVHVAGVRGGLPDSAEYLRRWYPMRPTAATTSVAVRAIHERATQHVPDVDRDDRPGDRAVGRARGYLAALAVPLLRGDVPIGSIAVTRATPGAYSPSQIALLQAFADQAVIAIENVRLFRELEQKSRELEAASRHKSEFLANMSHELRTPLNAVIGFAEVLTERMFGELNDKQDEYLRDIAGSGQHLLSLINDILDLSKIEAGRMELELGDFDLPMAIDSALMLVRERAGRRGIALAQSIGEGVGAIRADERKVRQVLLNLLSNALKFTPEGGRVDVAATIRDKTVEVSVADTGVGIAPEDQEAVFEEFRQVGTASKKVEGTGLGLTLCRKFVELHGGRIWVESRLGEGARFTFSLPVVREA